MHKSFPAAASINPVHFSVIQYQKRRRFFPGILPIVTCFFFLIQLTRVTI